MELSDITNQLATLRHEPSVSALRVQLYRDLKHDVRYAPVIRDLKRNTKWDRTRIYHVLESAASDIDDLLSPIQPPLGACDEETLEPAAPDIDGPPSTIQQPLDVPCQEMQELNHNNLREGPPKGAKSFWCMSHTAHGTCATPSKCHFSHKSPTPQANSASVLTALPDPPGHDNPTCTSVPYEARLRQDTPTSNPKSPSSMSRPASRGTASAGMNSPSREDEHQQVYPVVNTIETNTRGWTVLDHKTPPVQTVSSNALPPMMRSGKSSIYRDNLNDLLRQDPIPPAPSWGRSYQARLR